ncbi:HNH endonuclease [Pseudoxanthomonas mexicana]
MTLNDPVAETEDPRLEWISRAQSMPNLRKSVPKWKTKITTIDQAGLCYWCGKSGLVLVPDHIIGPASGGTIASANVVMACKSCDRRKGKHDALAWCLGSVEKLERRRKALAEALCHPLGETIKDRQTVWKHLHRRWEHQRFTVFLGGGHLLWPRNAPPPAHVVVALRGMGAVVGDVGRWTCATLSERMPEALAMLVSVNALVRSVGHGGPAVHPSAAAVVRLHASPTTASPG